VVDTRNRDPSLILGRHQAVTLEIDPLKGFLVGCDLFPASSSIFLPAPRFTWKRPSFSGYNRIQRWYYSTPKNPPRQDITQGPDLGRA